MKDLNIEYTEGGLKCDNPKCDREDNTITFSNYTEWVNKPCPKCGENVLTEEDFKRAEILRSSIDIVNSLSPEELEILQQLAGNSILNSPMFKDAKGIENLLEVKDGGIDVVQDGKVEFTVNTHKEIKITEIKPTNPET